MTLPPNLNVYLSAAAFVIGAYVVALYVGLIVWTFRDIHARSRDMLAQIMAVLLVAMFTLPGLVIYLLLRPHGTLAEEYERNLAEEAILQDLDERRVCPSCQRRADPDFVVCPYCHEQLRLRCTGCGRLLRPNWDVCPYCGLFREQAQASTSPAARRRGEREPAPAHREPLSGPEAMIPDLETAAVEMGPPESRRASYVRMPSLDTLREEPESPDAASDRAIPGTRALKALRSFLERTLESSEGGAPEGSAGADAEDQRTL